MNAACRVASAGFGGDRSRRRAGRPCLAVAQRCHPAGRSGSLGQVAPTRRAPTHRLSTHAGRTRTRGERQKRADVGSWRSAWACFLAARVAIMLAAHPPSLWPQGHAQIGGFFFFRHNGVRQAPPFLRGPSGAADRAWPVRLRSQRPHAATRGGGLLPPLCLLVPVQTGRQLLRTGHLVRRSLEPVRLRPAASAGCDGRHRACGDRHQNRARHRARDATRRLRTRRSEELPERLSSASCSLSRGTSKRGAT